MQVRIEVCLLDQLWIRFAIIIVLVLRGFSRRSLHLFEIPNAPTLVEISLGRCVKAQIDPPALARNGLNPVLLFAFGSRWPVVKIYRAILVFYEFAKGVASFDVERWMLNVHLF